MTLGANSIRIGRQPAYFSNMKQKKNSMFTYIDSLEGKHLWIKYVNYTIQFDELHMEIVDMQKALAFNRKSEAFCHFLGKHSHYVVNMARICENSYSWSVFHKFKWTIIKYKEYINV